MNLRFDPQVPGIEEFWTLFATTGWNDEYRLSQQSLHEAISRSWRVISVYHESRLVGFGRVMSDGLLHAMIYDLIVSPSYQNLGIGSEMLKRLLDSCRAAGIPDIQLFCARGKRGFYERRGFRARADDSPGMEYVEECVSPHPGRAR